MAASIYRRLEKVARLPEFLSGYQEFGKLDQEEERDKTV
jgi:hypothetical protein